MRTRALLLILGAAVVGALAGASPSQAAAPVPVPVAPAVDTKFHAVDSAILLPNSEPDALPSIEDFGPELLASLGWKTMVRGLAYEDDKPVANAIGTVEESTARCMASPKNWKAVAMRLDPFFEPTMGSPNATANTIPVVRMTFQPFCFTDRAADVRGVTGDAAIRFMFVVGDKADVAPFLGAWDALGDAVTKSGDVPAKRDDVRARAAKLESHAVIDAISFLRDRRIATKASTAAFDRQAASLESSLGLPAIDVPGQRKASLVQPLFSNLAENDITWKALLGSLRPSLDADHLESVGMMSSARGGLGWVFSRYNPRRHALAPLVVTRDTARGDVAVVSNLGTHDFKELGDRKLSAAEKAFYGRTSVTGRMDESPAQAEGALAIYARQNDPAQTSHFQQSCMECHASQERGTAAMQASTGGAPREFGYFFRAFGYQGGEPFASRRLFREVDAITRRLDEKPRLASIEGKGS